MTDNTINDDMTMGGATSTLLAGRYRVVRQLGQGGMGAVWLAEDAKLDGFKVAVKMLPSVLVNNKRAYAQVKAEALVSLKLSHSNIATVRAFEEESGNPFLVMDYIDGQTLDDYLAEKGKLTEEETVKLLKPVAAALDYAHGQGVVHRDVKPGNIMIRKDGTPFVLDFGIAREIQETMTRVTGKLSSGTLLYMSPEQLNGDAPKPAQDIYSFAAMAYECLRGEPPFSRGGVEDQIKHKLPEPLGPQFANCGQGVMVGLAKLPEARPMTCAAVLEKGGKKVAKTSAGSSASKTRIAVVGALLVLAAFAGIGGWFGWSAYCRTEENRLATIKAEMERKSAWRRLELETDRLASQVNEAQRVSVREQFAKREGLAAKVKELEDAAKSGQLALSATNLVAATNWFRVALNCSDWLSTNAVLHAQCMQAAQEALKARKAADAADAKNLASNEYVRAVIAFGRADEGLKAARFEEARSRWMKSAGLFEEAERNAMARKKSEADRVLKKIADLKRAFDEFRFKEIVNDPEAEKIPELRFLSGLIYENGLGGVSPDLKRAVDLYGGTTGVCTLAEAHLAQMLLSGDYLDKDASEMVTNRIVACLPEIKSRADREETLAAVALYNIYDDGIGVKKNRQLGRKWLERAASGGNVFAKYLLSVFAYWGNDVYPKDRNRSATLMREVEPALWYVSLWAKGMMLMQEKQRDLAEQDFLRSLPTIKSLALQGCASVQCVLGDMYDEGYGVPKDSNEAVRWYRKAAEKGKKDAQHKLGFALEHGEGCEKNEVEAVEWYRKAADKGHAVAQWNLGLIYKSGNTAVNKDLVKAHDLFRKAADQGFSDARRMVESFALNGAIRELKAGDQATVTLPGGESLELVYCPPGSFLMGSPEDEPGRFEGEAQHSVGLSQGFWIGKYEVTQKQWQSVMGNNPSKFKSPTRPVEQVSWADCQEFIRKVNALDHLHVSLPTEAQWEYACRAGSTTALPNGLPFHMRKLPKIWNWKTLDAQTLAGLDSIAWWDGNANLGFELSEGADWSNYEHRRYMPVLVGTHPVGEKNPNTWGLYDMIGNVSEWCEDWYEKHDHTPQTNPVGPRTGNARIMRGGGWGDSANSYRSSARCSTNPENRFSSLGFRVVCVSRW